MKIYCHSYKFTFFGATYSCSALRINLFGFVHGPPRKFLKTTIRIKMSEFTSLAISFLNNLLVCGQTEEVSCHLWPRYFSLNFRPSLLKTVSKLVKWNKITDFYRSFNGHNGNINRYIFCCSYKDVLQK
jgi:hypothetical protein